MLPLLFINVSVELGVNTMSLVNAKIPGVPPGIL